MPVRSTNRLLIALALLFVMQIIGTVGYKLLTGGSHGWPDCLYMAVVTLSGIGYREIIVTSQFPGARAFTIILIFSGMGILFYSVSTVTAIMVEMDLRDVFKRRKMKKDIKQLRNHVIVCGAGATGSCIARELEETGVSFVIVEHDEDRLNSLQKLGAALCLRGDATNDDILIEAGIDHASGLAAALSSEKDNLFLTLTARQLNPSLRIVARGLDDSVNQKLRRAGADATVAPNVIGGLRMASELIRPAIVSFLDTMLRGASAAIRFEELLITPKSKYHNKTIRSTKLREDANLLIVALRRPGSMDFEYNPPADFTLTDGMILVVLGEAREINRLKKLHAETT